MKKLLSVLFLVLSGTVLFAAPAPKEYSYTEKMWTLGELSGNTVTSSLAACTAAMLNDPENYTAHYSFLNRAASLTMSYLEYTYFELDTGISSAWLKTADDYVKALQKANAILDSAVALKRTSTEKFKEWRAYYAKTLRGFDALLKRPAKKVIPPAEKKRLLAQKQQEAIALMPPDTPKTPKR